MHVYAMLDAMELARMDSETFKGVAKLLPPRLRLTLVKAREDALALIMGQAA